MCGFWVFEVFLGNFGVLPSELWVFRGWVVWAVIIGFWAYVGFWVSGFLEILGFGYFYGGLNCGFGWMYVGGVRGWVVD